MDRSAARLFLLLTLPLSACALWPKDTASCDPDGRLAQYFADADGDGYGSGPLDCTAVDPGIEYVLAGGDCDDVGATGAAIHPGANEVCDSIDNDCDGRVDDDDDSLVAGTTWWFYDLDGDGFGSSFAVLAACVQPPGFAHNGEDCDDADGDKFPGQYWYRDEDGDRFGDPDNYRQGCDESDNGYVLDAGDCDDRHAERSPETIWYKDDDGDGYGSAEDCVLDGAGRYVEGEGCGPTCLATDELSADHPGDCAPEDPAWSLVCPWVQLSVGAYYTCGLDAGGVITCWGAENGAIDEGQASDVPDATDFQAVSAGWFHTCGLHDDGAVECWGSDLHGKSSGMPESIAYESVSAGYQHTCAVRQGTGEVDCWGVDDGSEGLDFRQVTDTPEEGGFVVVSAGSFHTCALLATGELRCWGIDDGSDADLGQVSSAPVSGVFDSLSSGTYHSCALESGTGEVECWGVDDGSDFDLGQVSDTPTGEAFTSLSAGYHHTCGVRADGGISCWGVDDARERDFGQVTEAPTTTANHSVGAGGAHSCALLQSGAIECWGDDQYAQASPPDSAFVAVGATPNGSCASTAGSTGCWGDPGVLPALSMRLDGADAGYAHSCALDSVGGIFCWGDEFLGSGPPEGEAFRALSVGIGDACAVRSTGGLECWGLDSDDLPTEIPDPNDYTSVSVGEYQVCGVHGATGEVECWGDVKVASEPASGTFLTASAGRFHACGVRAEGGAACWGSFEVAGEISEVPGPDDYTEVGAGVYISCGLHLAGDIECWGDDSDGVVTNTPMETDFVSLSVGDHHACGVRSTGQVTCWGADVGSAYDRGQVSDTPTDADFASAAAGAYHTCAARSSGEVECWGDSAAPFDGGGVVEISGGLDHVCARLDTGYVLCGGSDDRGQTEAPAERMAAMSIGRNHGCALTAADHEVVCWGDNSDGQLPAELVTGALSVAAGGAHTCAVDGGGAVQCWGDISGTRSDLAFGKVTAGYAHACGLDAAGAVTCWGRGDEGQGNAPAEVFVDVQAGGWFTCGLLEAGGSPEVGYPVTCWGADELGQVSDAPAYLFSELHLGDEHACGLKLDGLLACWGRSNEGQLDWPLPSAL